MLNSIHLPALLRTARESPEFAQMISVSEIKTTQAVQPVNREISSVSGLPNTDGFSFLGRYSKISFLPYGLCSIVSILMNVSLSAAW